MNRPRYFVLISTLLLNWREDLYPVVCPLTSALTEDMFKINATFVECKVFSCEYRLQTQV